MDQQQIIIWFAGFYEGEGTIVNDISNRNKLRISISQNDRTPLDIGKIYGVVQLEKESENYQQVIKYVLDMNGE